MELSGQFPIRLLCTKTGIPRSSFYNWKKSVEHPPEQKKRLVQSIGLFQEYHGRFPSHGYRWLNAKIRLDKGIVFSDPYAHKCCKIAGISPWIPYAEAVSGAVRAKARRCGSLIRVL